VTGREGSRLAALPEGGIARPCVACAGASWPESLLAV